MSAYSRLNDVEFLAGMWSLDSHADDVSGHEYDGTVSGMVYADGPFGQMVGSFDGDNDNVNVGDVTQLNTVSEFSITFWMNQDVSASADVLLFKNIDATHRIRVETTAGDRFYFIVYDGAASLGYGYFTTSTTTPAGSWKNVAMVFDGAQAVNANRVIVYVDGSAQTLVVGGTFPSASPNLFGADLLVGGSVTSFGGLLSRFRLYNVALTGDEAKALFLMEQFGSL